MDDGPVPPSDSTGGEPFGNEAVQHAGLAHRDKSGDSCSMVGDSHLVAIPDNVKVATEVIS